jgi:hypothetical protein
MLADELDYVVGVDTHLDEHVLAVVVAPTGGVVAQRSVRASARGYAPAVRFADQHAPGARVWAVEGAGHYGAGLARYLSDQGETVLEAGRGPRDERRLQGKDDPLDAVRAARAALASEKLVVPRTGQRREALRLLLVARRGAVEMRRRALVQLRSVIVTARIGFAGSCRRCPSGACSSVAATSAARAPVPSTSSPRSSSCARSRDESRRRPRKPNSSSGRSSPTSARSHHSCSSFRARGRGWGRLHRLGERPPLRLPGGRLRGRDVRAAMERAARSGDAGGDRLRACRRRRHGLRDDVPGHPLCLTASRVEASQYVK